MRNITMNFNLIHRINSYLYRSGVILNPNIPTPQAIKLGDILTHRYNHEKMVVACVEDKHMLLVDQSGKIHRLKSRRIVELYCRNANDPHNPNNAAVALEKASQVIRNDRRVLTRLGLRLMQVVYLDNIYRSVMH
ncbi:hypothetical protein PL75_10060 [Neisseria arctica]|uniref:Uncharacterized protein n=2 Tax=Neisseria arctica TaxID=1470200 RepID=A0A0J0YPL3_9NEIS|nr:hypothetical protein PL75_10060 [Neisseria arctica]